MGIISEIDMTEVRQDYLTGQYVCLSPVRGLRPRGGRVSGGSLLKDARGCPFCGDVPDTPGQTFAFGQARAVPNRYPALNPRAPAGRGFHEVVIDSPEHGYSLAHAPTQSVTDSLICIRERMRFFSRQQGVRAIQAFKNDGANAGASLSHPHWQIIAMPFVPPIKTTMLLNFGRYYAGHGCCYLCGDDAPARGGAVFETEDVLAFCPEAALYSYGVNIMTKRHAHAYIDLGDEVIAQFALAIQRVLAALMRVYEPLSYNICFQCAPLESDETPGERCAAWHFFMQIIPRSWHVAGFELGCGSFINAVLPEVAAKRLRSLIYG